MNRSRIIVKAFLILLLLLGLFLVSCASSQQSPPYTPNFNYLTQKATGKIDVTVGLVAPQFIGEGKTYWAQSNSDDIAKAFASGLRASFNDLLIAKGFNVAGPYDSIENMTFPEKKGSDFALYPDMDISVSIRPTNLRQEAAFTGTGLVCELLFNVSGNVSLVAKEPLSGEKMWLKRIEVPAQKKSVSASGPICAGSRDEQSADQNTKNEWARAHESIYQSVMRGLDKYVNAEEFQVLKKQSAELRAKKVY